MKHEVILTAVINWNGWRDTLICLRSMLALAEPPFHLLVCDNASTDDSHEKIRDWIREAFLPAGESSQSGAEGASICSFIDLDPSTAGCIQSVHLMRLARNYGYGGAINRCVVWGREALSPDCYWLLNNDVSLDPQALSHLVAASRFSGEIGLCGSVLLDWDEPQGVQAIGGIFNWPLAVGSHLKRLPPGTAFDDEPFYGVDYPVGASLLVTREYIEAVGLMEESYFLYYEEIDWAQRGRALGFRPAVALRSLVRHRAGASTGSRGGIRSISMLSEYYGVVNRVRFTRKFSPLLVPVVWLSLLLLALDRAVHREWKRAALILRLMVWPGSVARP